MKSAKLFMNGRSQAVRLPREFRFEGDEVLVERKGNAVVLRPSRYRFGDLMEVVGRFKGRLERMQPAQDERNWK